jgi:uncharacterized membrane protein YheB (UPF0754 family)
MLRGCRPRRAVPLSFAAGPLIPLIHNHALSLVSIPLFGGVIGYVINRTGVWMLFYPVEFRGVQVPGLQRLAHRLPKQLRQIPGLMQGGIGWQGIIPSRAAKMGSIAVDKQVAKVGSARDFFDALDPDRMSEHMLRHVEGDVHDLVERSMTRDYPELWRDLPPRAREVVHARVQEQMPAVVDDVTAAIGEHIDELLDPKMLVMRRLEGDRALSNKLFEEVGKKEFRFIMRFGFVFAFLCGIPVAVLVHFVPQWWVLPVAEAFIGYWTNWLGIWLIYEPIEPRRIGPFCFHGLFLRRQHEASEAYAEVIATDVITVSNIAEELMTGPSADRTRTLIASCLEPAIDDAVGGARTLVVAAKGAEDYEAMRESVAAEAAEATLSPLQDEDFNRSSSRAIRRLFTERMRAMPASDFVEALRSATREDEWLLVAHGAVFGVVGGLIHYAVFGV